MNSTGPSFLRAALPSWRGGPERSVCRLGLASRGESGLSVADAEHAIERGVDFLNWCGAPDYLSRTIAGLGSRRKDVVVCVQFEARTAADARAELDRILTELRTDYVDILTFYYVEAASEWDEIRQPGGSLDYCEEARRQGRVRLLGVTSHQRPLAADIARSGLVDLLMIRYNAAHRGAETEIFPATLERRMPVVAYTALRWGALLRSTPDDPPGFTPPPASSWYRFVLHNPAATIALAAPNSPEELREDLQVLDAPSPLSPAELDRLAAHGGRVRRHAGSFP